MELLKNFTLNELEEKMIVLGESTFRARQIFKWTYQKRTHSFSEMTDIPKIFRNLLSQNFAIDSLELVDKVRSQDKTIKLLFRTTDENIIESVWIPDPPRYTFCVSSQIGCALECTFCATGKLGLIRSLQPAEIVDQVCLAMRTKAIGKKVTNLVFMGMGEPLANYSNVTKAIEILQDPGGLQFSGRRITVSTSGIVPQIINLGKENFQVNLAVSLNATTNEVRDILMPINKKYPLELLLQACTEFPLPRRKRITFEYLLIDGINDTVEDARRLVKLLHGQRAKVNLIPMNPHPGISYKRPRRSRILEFQKVLLESNLTAIIRNSRGDDVGAACGQLGSRYLNRLNKEVMNYGTS